MKHPVPILFFLFSCLLGGAAGLYSRLNRSQPLQPETVQKPLSTPSHIQKIPSKCNLSIPVKLNNYDPVELFFNYQDEFNYVSIFFTQSEAEISTVINGVFENESSAKVPSGTENVTVEFRDQYSAVYCGRKLIAECTGAQYGDRTIGMRGIDPDAVHVTGVEPVFLKDDFMRAPEEHGNWEAAAGTWGIKTQKNPSMSANAFSYEGKGEHAIALTGKQWWHEYSFEVSLNSGNKTQAGIVTEYTDSDHYTYCLFGGDTAELVSVVKGEHQRIESKNLPAVPGQWYRITGHVSRHFYEVLVDDHPLFSQNSNLLRQGRFGILTRGEEPSYFDDISVSELTVKRLEPSHPDAQPFTALGGKWKTQDNSIICSTSKTAEAVWGSGLWSEYAVCADITPGTGGSGGIGLYRAGEDDSVRIEVDAEMQRCTLIKRINGEEQTLVSLPYKMKTSGVRVVLGLRDSVLSLELDGTPVFAGYFDGISSGAPFLWGRETLGAEFSSVYVEFFNRSEAVETGNEIFTAEYSMAQWAGSRSDWAVTKETVDGKPVQTYFHKASFPGNIHIEADVKGESDAPPVLIIGSSTHTSENGYRFKIDASKSSAVLYKNGVQLEQAVFKTREANTVGFRRIGTTLVGLLNGFRILEFNDTDAPLSGNGAGWIAGAGAVTPEDVWVYSDALYDYSFTKSPSEWRIGSGTWEVTNRWQCDPRWRFFSGYADDGNAVIWNKRVFPGDLTVECYVGVKMNNKKGKKYSYARDLNLVICSDGKDTLSGYNFMFGGFGNTQTCITRGSSIAVSDTEVRIPVEQNIHRRWFYLKAEKKGADLTFSIDGKTVCSFTDPDPLTGSRIGFWTYDNGMMVARVRISSQSGKQFETPFNRYPDISRCVYDK